MTPISRRGIADKVTAQVLRLAELAWDCGLDGIVCAPHEVALLRSRFEPDFTLVVPGIRPSGSAPAIRSAPGPADAAAAGADVLVIGRPITGRAIRAPRRRRSTPRSQRRGRPEPWCSRSRSAA